jgi:hypothetical protein
MRTSPLRSWTGLLAIVGGLVRFAAPAAAQTQTLPGQVLDARAQPVAGLEVFLHRVTEGGGTIVATDTTDAAGAFALRVDGAVPEAVFFVAARYDGQLHIGSMLRAPFPAADYVLRVGVDPVTATPEATSAPATPDRRGITLLVMGMLLLAAAVAALRMLRPPAERRMLLRLAQLEETRDRTGRMSPHAETERSRILARLRYGRSA